MISWPIGGIYPGTMAVIKVNHGKNRVYVRFFSSWWCELLFDQYYGRGLTLDNIFITSWLESGQGVDIAFKIRTKAYVFVLSLFEEPELILSTYITLRPRLWNPSSETTVPYFSNTLNTCNSKAADVLVTHEAIRYQQPLYSPNSP